VTCIRSIDRVVVCSVLLIAAAMLVSVTPAVASGESDPLAAVRADYDRGALDRALAAVDQHLASAPRDPDALFLKGVVLADLGRRDEAESAFRSVLQIDPTLPEAYNNLAVLHAADGEFQQAIDVLKSALGTHPSYNAAFDNLSKLYARLASDAYSRALGVRARAEESIPLVLLRDVERVERIAGRATTGAVAQAPEPDVVPSRTETVPAQPDPEEEQASDWRAVVVESPTPPLADGAPVVELGGEDTSSVALGVPDPSELAIALQGWASAWSNQDVDTYLAAYSRNFIPGDGLDRATWAVQRRERLTRPEYVRVSVALLDAWVESPTVGSVRFLQTYESDRFQDQVNKVLRLEREDGQWRILEERVETP